ncbi:DUF5320 domain-containing protein [Mucilaginibacter auburnensis]|uniref:YXWGXW repeat-containing protein n=1 Tax=Mucilaginibacter auburnensis TaxID=1457233 RepID=A0A2H9VVZ5_9SPHI|nr:DUF5320 domain-containing protein [Mucilaginibacter auburnensis]PJJ84952.1 hypothetical protein CLV57_1974 [Mucilaginibacter auburnensis]
MRNLKYLIAICVISLSACSTSQKLASTPGADDDDVYFTQAKAGDEIMYADDSYQANGYNNNGYNSDEYYYYGDYASRINRFDYYSPFGYNSFYYGYSPYNSMRWGLGYGMGGWNRGLGFNYGFGWGYDPFFYGGIYSPYFYDPFYASFYGYGWGLGYGYAYSPWGYPGIGGYGWGYGGGFVTGGYSRQNPRPVYAGGTSATVARPGRTTVYETMPGRRPGDLSTQSIYSTGGQTRAVRSTSSRDGQTRQVIQQVDRRPTYNPAPAPSPSFGGGGGGGNSGGGGGGGGRPVRP